MLIDVVIDETPGMGTTLILFSIHLFKINRPGSDNIGVPASDIKDKLMIGN